MSGTVKVRIAVSIDGDGNWNAAGYSSQPNIEAAAELAVSEGDHIVKGTNKRIVIVEADLPIPTETTVKGTVTEEQS